MPSACLCRGGAPAPDHLCDPPQDLFKQGHIWFLCCGPQSWIQHCRWGLRVEQRGRSTSLNLLATPLLMQLRIRTALRSASTRCWLTQFFIHQHSPSLSLQGCSQSSHHSACIYICLGCVIFREDQENLSSGDLYTHLPDYSYSEKF